MTDLNNAGSAGHFFAFRLFPGEDLLEGIRKAVRSEGLRAGFVAAAVGSLSRACLRYAGKPDGTILEGCFETVSLSGTAEEGGEHLHASLSDPEGNVVGGHVLEGCVVRTTMEIILGELPELRFSREYCPSSTYMELAVHRRTNEKGE